MKVVCVGRCNTAGSDRLVSAGLSIVAVLGVVNGLKEMTPSSLGTTPLSSVARGIT